MFGSSFLWNYDDDDESSIDSEATAWFSTNATTGRDDDDDDKMPGTLAYFQAFKDHVESQLKYPDASLLPTPLWTDTLQASQTARQSLAQANKVLEDMTNNKEHPPPQEQIDQAQKAVNQAQSTLEECNKTVQILAKSLLTTTSTTASHDDPGDATTTIPEFISKEFDNSDWVTFMVLQDPQHWADYCCPHVPDNPDPQRVARAMSFLLNVHMQRQVLGSGGPRGGNYGGYLELQPQLVSESAAKEPVLERLAQAVALEFANADYKYFFTEILIDPVARFLSYEQAYLMGDLDPAFSTFSVWELRLAVNSPCREWELQWGRECLQTYRPDWALTDDPQWRYCRLVRLDVGYMHPTWTSYPYTMDQILSGGGECGPRAWFGRFICQAFGIPIWGVRQVGHAAMSRWTENGWMVCLGAGFPYAWWEDTCGLDFLLETQVRASLPNALAYLQQVLPLEWLAKYQGKSNAFILKDCTYFDPASPWYSLSLAHRQLLTEESANTQRIPHYPRSHLTLPKISRLQFNLPKTPGCVRVWNSCITIPADTTTTNPSDDVLIMPSFTGGHQVFLGKDATLEYKLEEHWLAPVTRTYRITVKVATAHAKDTGLQLKILPKNGATPHDDDGEESYSLPLPYTKALWEDTQSIEISLNSKCGAISLQREWTELYGISIKEIRLQLC
eukprot:scaffold10643_cov151-Amphora_coffeaeformis.AAC.3